MSKEQALPQSWSTTKLGDIILEFVGGGTPSRKVEAYYRGTIPWFTVKDMRTKRPADAMEHISEQALRESAAHLIPSDTVIIATRIGLGKVIRLPFAAAINQDLKALITPPELEKGYLEYWMDYSAPFLQSIGSGTTVKGLRIETLCQLAFPLSPLAEQRRIVAAIEEQFTRLDAGVAALKRAQAALKRYRAAVLKAAVEGRLTASWRAQHPDVRPASELLVDILTERRVRWEANLRAKGKDPAKAKYDEPQLPRTEGLPELPQGWVWATVEQVSQFTRYGTSAKTNDEQDGVPILRMGNIQDGALDFTSLKYLPTTHTEFPELFLQLGDLLFNRTNSAELVGKSAVYHGIPSPCSFASYLIGVRFSSGCSSDFAGFVLNSAHGREWVASVVVQQVGQANVNGSKLRAFHLPLPPKAEQDAIVATVEECITVISMLEATIAANLKRAERLRQAILERAFTGRLVPQDPADEPASALLERIRAEQECGRRPETVSQRLGATGDAQLSTDTAQPVARLAQEPLW